MFDVSFTELMVIGVVALIVLGPERLPKVARTAGHLFGRLQRYVSDVKQQVKSEMDAEDLKQFKTQMQEVKDAVGGVEQSIHSGVTETEHSLVQAIDTEPLPSLEFVEEPVAHETTRAAPSPQLELPLAADAAKTDKPA
jgi:sec-independent protein translocase protein TatB